MTDKKPSLTYADAGVNIEKANSLVSVIKKIAEQTRRPGVIGEIGGFGGLFSLNTNNYERPVLVSATDGVGTKLKLAFMADKHDTIGIDLVAMSVNDIAVQGAKALFFLDYLSTGKIQTETVTSIIQGIGEGCKLAKCALIGGETAEMPGFYKDNEYDLAGFAVGVVDYDKIIDGSEIHMGDKIIGIASSGLHSNGYSLARKIFFDILKYKIDQYIPEFEKTIAEELLTPTRIYSETILHIVRDFKINGLIHVTGGGFSDNITRIVPETCKTIITRGTWEIPPVFTLMKEAGNVAEDEMMRTFNNGIGLIAIVPENVAGEVVDRLNSTDEKAAVIGRIEARKESEERFVLE